MDKRILIGAGVGLGILAAVVVAVLATRGPATQTAARPPAQAARPVGVATPSPATARPAAPATRRTAAARPAASPARRTVSTQTTATAPTRAPLVSPTDRGN